MQHTLYKSRIQAWPKTTAKLPSHEPTSKPSQNHITVKLRVRKATVNALSIGLEQKKKGPYTSWELLIALRQGTHISFDFQARWRAIVRTTYA